MPAGTDRSRDAAADLAAELIVAAVSVEAAEVSRDVPLGPLTTYRVGGRAAVFVRLFEPTAITAIATASRSSGLPVLPVGRGSNMLVADRGFDGIAVSVVELREVISIDETSAVVTVSAGVSLPVLARKTAAAGLTGFEWAVGVPGSVGGAVRMNAGGHGSDIAASLIDVAVADLRTGVETRLAAADLGLAFRSSELPETSVVLEARLQLAPGNADASARIISEIVAWRRANQPGGQNAGSVFVNPVPGEVSSGSLIDAAGLRGERFGTASVSTKHANFIQADDGGSADDVHALMAIVRERVEATSGFALRSEIKLVGFDGGATS